MDIGLTHGLKRAARLRGRETALVDGAVSLRWEELLGRVSKLAGALAKMGVGPGDRVALLASNGHHSVETYLAALWAGAIVAPFNHRLSAAELAQQMHDAEPSVLVVDAPLLAQFRELATETPSIRDILLVGGDAGERGVRTYEGAIAEAAPVEDAGRSGDDIACLFYTGGTTGVAKGVMLTHANIVANSLNFIAGTGIDEKVVHLHCGPLFHVAAGVRIFSVTMLGGRHVMLPRFDAREVLEVIQGQGVTLATFVPTMLRTLLEEVGAAPVDLSSLEIITYGAAPMPEALLRGVMEIMPDVRFVQSYGMTETSPIITMLGSGDHRLVGEGAKRMRSAGRAALLAEVSIEGEGGLPLPVGERGEIVAKGPMVMAGYWRRPEATAEVLRNGWMHTGDVGYLDADGYLYVVDRLKDVIISGGENVYSQEVENAICSHPAVAQCAVFGRPDPKWGEAVHAVVVAKAGLDLREDEVREHCRRLIAGFKCPRSVEVRSRPLPLSGANKVLKTQLRDELLAREAV